VADVEPSSALLMTHNQLPRLVCIDAKVAVQRVNW
jgi:hypothetical protein